MDMDQVMQEAATSGQPWISVVIPHLNQPELLASCLDSLDRGRRKLDELIVVDNGSRRLPQEVCDSWPSTFLYSEAKPGPGMARNTGVAKARGDILAFIDADCIADPGWLEAADAAMADPSATILGGDVRIGCVDPERLTLMEAYESIYAFRMDKYISREGFTGTGNLVVRRTVMDKVGPFGGIEIAEDIDWGKRATGMGFKIRYVAGMKVYHPARSNFSQLQAKWDRHIAHFYAKERSRRFGSLSWMTKAAALAISPIYELGQIATSDRVSGLRSRSLAFLGLVRIRLYRTRMMVWLAINGNPDAVSGRWNRAVVVPDENREV